MKQIGHTQRFEDDRYQADMMVRRVTNLEVVAYGYEDAIDDYGWILRSESIRK